MGRRTRAGLTLAAAVVLLSGCGGDGDAEDAPGGGGTDKGGAQVTDVKKAPLAQKGAFSAMFCAAVPANDDGGVLYSVTLRSYSAGDGKLVAERYLRTENLVEPVAGCPGDESSGPGKPARYGLSKDLTMLAAIGDDRVMVFDLNTGKELGPPDPDAFETKPFASNAAFHPVTNEVWYATRPDRTSTDVTIRHRDPSGGMATEQSIPEAGIPAEQAKDLVTAETIQPALGSRAPISPSGVIASSDADGQLQLRRMRAGEPESPDTPALSGGDGVRCDPALWIDDTRLVCRHDTLQQITLSADHRSVVKTEGLIPENDKNPGLPVLSEDGKSLYFLADNANRQEVLYRVDLTSPGAQPKKIAALDPPVDGAERHYTSLVGFN